MESKGNVIDGLVPVAMNSKGEAVLVEREGTHAPLTFERLRYREVLSVEDIGTGVPVPLCGVLVRDSSLAFFLVLS